MSHSITRKISRTQQKKASSKNLVPFSAHNPDGGQTRISCPPQVVSYSPDTLHLTLDVDFNEKLIEQLSTAKKAIQETPNEMSAHFQPGATRLFSFSLQRSGNKLYPYILNTGDITLCISGRKAGSSIPNAALQIGSISCHSDTLDILRMVRKWLYHYKCRLILDQVSRIDLCCDFAQNINDLNLDDQSFHIKRAKKFCPVYYGLKLEGMTIGKGEIMLRIYDKIKEMKDKRASHKMEFFAKIWGENALDVTRVEFQLRRSAIKDFFPKGSTLRQVLGDINRVWNYLTCEWFRHTENQIDKENKNQKRAVISSFWQSIQKAYSCSKDTQSLKRDKKQKHISVPALMDQVKGLILTITAAYGHASSDFFGIVSTGKILLQDALNSAFDDVNFETDYENRVAQALVSF